MDNNCPENPEILVLGSCGLFGFGVTGAIKYFQKRDKITHVNKILGSGCGGMLACLLNLGFTADEMYIICKNIKKGFSSLKTNISKVISAVNNKYIISQKYLSDIFEKEFKKKGIDPNIDFETLHGNTGLSCFVFVYNLNESEVQTLSYKTTPKMPVIEGMKASISTPRFIETFVYKEKKYSDANISCPYPVDYISDKKGIGITYGVDMEKSDELKYLYSSTKILISKAIKKSKNNYKHHKINIENFFDKSSYHNLAYYTLLESNE